MTNFMDMMKQAKELQANMVNMQAELERMEITGTAGAGLVTVTLNGKGAFTGIDIDPSLARPDEVGILEDLIVAAASDARQKMEKMVAQRMQKMTGGLPLPPGMKLF